MLGVGEQTVESNMDWKRLLLLILSFIVYLAIGGFVFSALEEPEESSTRTDIRGYKESTLSELDCLSDERLEDMIEQIVRAVHAGLDPRQNLTSKSHWDFSSSFFFSGTVVTTIGYGRLSPRTQAGQNFCIMYAVVGIPFLGWLLSVVGEFYRESFRRLTDGLDHLLHDYCSVTQRKFRRCMMWLIVASVSYSVLVLIPAVLFTLLEGWPYRIAHYYCFITLTTIGFGDYVATADDTGHDPREELEILYDVAVVFWYIFGLSFFAVVISTIGTSQQKAAAKIESSLKNRPVRENTYNLNHHNLGDDVVQVKVQGGIVGPIRYHTPGPVLSNTNPVDRIKEVSSGVEKHDIRECSQVESETVDMATASNVLPNMSNTSSHDDTAI
ncbi:potassium channel subfamily K member 2-like isoform X2 [Asterias rubens]|uniref:potassium channel subfamily K member 2-like isoform X2 n=1 Tax=Asterias rubens TaxID=7604 RepID=UPI001455BF02|nr:potassium channel subfamily K member 2-like isoform X2 [Asterias rubens]